MIRSSSVLITLLTISTLALLVHEVVIPLVDCYCQLLSHLVR